MAFNNHLDACKMRVALSFIAGWFWILSVAVDQSSETAVWPRNCFCNLLGQSLTINCTQRNDTFIVDSIENEINAMLMENRQLSYLYIGNSGLRNVPIELCNLKRLISLFLVYNKLERLPDNCYTRLRNLNQVIADHNLIEYLQV